MDLNYLNNNQEYYIGYLKKWSTDVIKNKLWERFEDLHIDEIDSAFENTHTWLNGGILLLDYLNQIVDKNKFDCVLFKEEESADEYFRIFYIRNKS